MLFGIQKGLLIDTAVNPAVMQKEGEQLLAFAAKVVSRRLAGSHEIAHRLVRRVGRSDACQLAGSMQSRQPNRVAAVRLHSFA